MVIAFHTLDRKINLSENITKTLEILYEIIISACDWYKEKYCTVWEGDPLDYLEQEDLLWPDDASIKSKVIISYGESTLNDLNINTVIYIDPDNTLKDVPPIFISFNPPAVSDIDLLVLLDECIDILEESAKVLWLRLLDFPIENTRLVISETSDAILALY
ncbi:MAG: hypothetical protein KAU62_04035, partial [Candidatus Heimdallarchaeota archaeon]|nr:hypothetical protein [Candidatus Heimdallarchaeota archaeon]MCK4610306.1 hypothetical protein [Candidatus Heimdallarchaeota archaeon]